MEISVFSKVRMRMVYGLGSALVYVQQTEGVLLAERRNGAERAVFSLEDAHAGMIPLEDAVEAHIPLPVLPISLVALVKGG